MEETRFAAGRARPLFIGMIHLRALPGSPRYGGAFGPVIEGAVSDLEALIEGGADGAIVENFFDAPFYPRSVPAVTVAAMTSAAAVLRAHVPEAFLLGINVLRNDALAALSIASVVDAAFIRINVHTGVAVADQGLLHGLAHETLRLRAAMRCRVSILADVGVKHAVPLGPRSLEDEAKDTWERGLADALLVTGSRTGAPVDEDALVSVRTSVPDAPVLAASGVDAKTAATLARHCDGVVVGTWLKKNGQVAEPIDPERVRQMSIVLRRLRN
ncbi:MAG: BtpA/SgcQ family protein [Candidatus Eisenbacteria bacterium]|nr:BtpA/SgcQ family protein [Candidatus Latescibacterota bacterium]MBD3301447.1 BtpA/SgcQ family protein [Candidatus Eisenbacteria bacterium]